VDESLIPATKPPLIAEQRLSLQAIWWAVPTLHIRVNLEIVADKIRPYKPAFGLYPALRLNSCTCSIKRYRGHGPLLQFGVWFISGVTAECMRLQDAGLNNTAPVRPGMDAGRANRAMDGPLFALPRSQNYSERIKSCTARSGEFAQPA